MILSKLFTQEPQHPLADPKELKRIVAELPSDNPYRVVDEVVGWFEALEHLDGLRADRLADALSQLDQAAQPALRRVTRELLTSARLNKQEEQRYWKIGFEFWRRLDTLYGRVVAAGVQKEKGAETIRPLLPLFLTRQIAAQAAQYKWLNFRHHRPPKGFWLRLGQCYLTAVEHQLAEKTITLYPATSQVSCPAQEYLKVALLAASSLDSLQPTETELAEKLIGHFLPRFVMASGQTPGMLYWIDAALGQPPQRLAKNPQLSPSLRLIAPGHAPDELATLIRAVERGNLPEELNLGGQYPLRTLLKVLRHLALYWAPQPPMRRHKRHAVKSNLAVLHGFATCADILDPTVISPPEASETWVADNVSLGGFGATIEPLRNDWLRIGSLLCLRPEGGDNWLLGRVRRYGREGDSVASIGVQTLARQATTVEFRPQSIGSYVSPLTVRGIILRDDNAGDEIRVVLPLTTFDLRESLDGQVDGRRALLMPVVCEEVGPDYDLARYRLRFAE
jgi:hypothetical protein